MRSYNENVVRGLTKEQFLEMHPEAGADYDRICGVSEKVLRKVSQAWLDKNPAAKEEGVKVGDMYPM